MLEYGKREEGPSWRVVWDGREKGCTCVKREHPSSQNGYVEFTTYIGLRRASTLSMSSVPLYTLSQPENPCLSPTLRGTSPPLVAIP